MAVDMTIKIDKIDGESKLDKHQAEIDVLSWSWGMGQSGTFHTGGGGGAGKADFQDLTFTKWVDSASHALQLACAEGEHIKEATLTVRKAGKKSLDYIIIKMKKLLVTSVTTGGSGGEERLTEQVSLNFANVEYAYVPQKEDGSGDTKKEFKWNIEENKKV